MPKRGVLVICGLGAAPPATATLESLSLLKNCDVLVSDLGTAARTRLTKLIGRPCRRLGRDGDLEHVFVALKRGRSVACATWGQPLSFGALPAALRERASREGFRCSTPTGGASVLDAALTLTRQALGFSLDAVTVLERPTFQSTIPEAGLLGALVVSWSGGAQPLLRRLAALSPGIRECLRFKKSGTSWVAAPERVRLSGLGAKPGRLRDDDLFVVLPV